MYAKVALDYKGAIDVRGTGPEPLGFAAMSILKRDLSHLTAEV
jgi:hypothetical protein